MAIAISYGHHYVPPPAAGRGSSTYDKYPPDTNADRGDYEKLLNSYFR
jgi:hypothetical protein